MAALSRTAPALALCALCAFGAPAAAQDGEDMEARIEAARALTTMIGIEEQIDFNMDTIRPFLVDGALSTMVGGSGGGNFIDSLGRDYPGGPDAFRAAFVERLTENLQDRIPEIRERAAVFFAENMSRADLEATVTFLRSGVGSRWIALMPQAQQHLSMSISEFGRQAAIEAARDILTELGGAIERGEAATAEGAESDNPAGESTE